MLKLRTIFTCEELCHRWDIHPSDLNRLVRTVKLRALNGKYTLVEIKDNAYFYMDNHMVGAGAVCTGPLSVTDENGFYFNISDVEAFERENGITNLILPTDDRSDTTSITTKKGDADNTSRQNKKDKPHFDKQVWNEAVRLYKILLDTGFDGPGAVSKLKSAAKKELTQNRKFYKFIKQKHLNQTDLFALNPGQERRDFIGKLLQKITEKRGLKKNGAQRLYTYGKKNYQNHN